MEDQFLLHLHVNGLVATTAQFFIGIQIVREEEITAEEQVAILMDVPGPAILYEFTIEDPWTYTEPWGGEIPFERFNDRLYEYACHEGNYALSAVLSGARYEESNR